MYILNAMHERQTIGMMCETTLYLIAWMYSFENYNKMQRIVVNTVAYVKL